MQLLPGVLLLLFGAAMTAASFRKRRIRQDCTASVTACVVDVGRIKQRNGYRYFYKMRYTWHDKQYTAEFSGMKWYGEAGEETVISIDPVHPEKTSVNCADSDILGNFVMGLAIAASGVIWVIAGFFWS